MTTRSQDVRHAIAQRLSDAYAASAEAPDRRRDERIAAGFRPDPRAERLIGLRATDRAAYDRLPPTVRMGVGYYENSRDAHERLRGDDDA